MRNLKVARLGDNMRQVAVTEGDKVEAQIRFGTEVNGYGVGELAKRIGEATDAEIDRLVGEYDQQYAMAAELAAWRAAARGACAMRPGRSWACGPFSTAASSRRLPIRLRTSRGWNNCPAWPFSGSWPTATASGRRATGKRPPWCG